MKFNKKILIIIIIIILAIGGIVIPAIAPNTTVNNIVEDNNIEIVQQVNTQTNENTLEDAVIGYIIPQFEGLPQDSLNKIESFLIDNVKLDKNMIQNKFKDIQETF